jgi:hypothetical protein
MDERSVSVSEMSIFQSVAGALTVAAMVVPVSIFLRDLYKIAFPHKIIITDKNGDVLGEISAESVTRSDANELAGLHERIRQSGHVYTHST